MTFSRKSVCDIGPTDVSMLMEDINNFFFKNSLNLDHSGFPQNPPKKELKIDENIQKEYLDNINNTKSIDFILNNPERYKCILQRDCDDIKCLYSRKNHYDFENLTFLTASLPLYKFVFIDNRDTKPGLFNKDNRKVSRKELSRKLKERKFVIPLDAFEKEVETKIPQSEIVSPTAFAANDSYAFVGAYNYQIMFIPLDNKLTHISVVVKELYKVPFSLCLSNDSIFAISETSVFRIYPTTCMIYKINSKVKPLYPTVSDGLYFYSISKNFDVSMYSFYDNQFTLIETVHLHIPKSINLTTPTNISTDGTIITFIQNEGNKTYLYGFSLVTRRHLWTETYTNTLNDLYSFTYVPFTGRFVAFTPNIIKVYKKVSYIPNWILGYPIPKYSNKITIPEMFNILLFHGINPFSPSKKELENEIFTEFYKTKNIYGGYTMIGIMKNQDNTTYLNCLYKVTENLNIQTYIVYSFLYMMRDNPSIIFNSEDNLISSYLEKEFDLHLVLLFYELFDFKRIALTETAIANLINGTNRHWDFYRDQCVFIVESFIFNYVLRKVKEGNVSKSFLLLQVISENINNEAMKHLNSQRHFVFSTTTASIIWEFLLRAIYKMKDDWIKYSDQLSSIIDFTIDLNVYELDSDKELAKMLYRTQYLQLKLMFQLQAVKSIEFPTLEGFLRENKHPLNGEYPELDLALYRVLKRTYDISDMNNLVKSFFNIRNVMITKGIKAEDLQPLLTSYDNYYSESIIPFITSKDEKKLITNNTIAASYIRYVNKCCSHKKKQTKNSFLIQLQFKDEIKKHENDFLLCNVDRLNKLLKWSYYPFLYTDKVFTKSCFKITPELFQSIPNQVLEMFSNNETKICAAIEDKKEFFSQIMPMLSKFDNQDNNLGGLDTSIKNIYNSTLLMKIAFKAGIKLDFSKYNKCFIAILHAADFKIATTLLDAIFLNDKTQEIKEFLVHLLDAIGVYVSRGKSVFGINNKQEENIAILFEVTNRLRQLWNKSKNFKEIFLEYLSSGTLLSRAALFAVMNDSFDYIRNDANLSFYTLSGQHIEGKVESFDFQKSIFTVNSTQYNINKVTHIIPKIDTIAEIPTEYLQKFAAIFEEDRQFNCQTNAFRSASLSFFTKNKEFCKCLSKEFVKKNIDSADPSQFFEGEAFNDFIYSFSRMNQQLPFFLCTNQQIKLQNRHENLNVKKGTIKTFDKSLVFTTTPFHPRAQSKLIFNAFSMKREDVLGNIIIVALNKSTAEAFVTENIAIRAVQGSNNEISFDFQPEKHCFIIKTGKETIKYLIPQSTKILFAQVELQPSKAINYRFESDCKLVKAKENTKQAQFLDYEGRIMTSSLRQITFPYSDSLSYNQTFLEETSDIITRSFDFCSALAMINNLEMKGSARFILDALSYANPFPFDEQIDLSKFRIRSLAGDLQNLLLDFAKKQMNNLTMDELLQYFAKKVQNKDSFFIDPNNTTSFILDGQMKAELSHCIIIAPESKKPTKRLGIGNSVCLFSHPSLIIPSFSVNGTIMDLLINTRHIIAIAAVKEAKDLNALKDIINNMEKDYKFTKMLFATQVELIDAYFPILETEGRMNQFSLTSFLFSESRIFYDTNTKYSIIECLSNPIQYGDNPLSFPSEMSEKTFIGIKNKHNKGVIEEEYSININNTTKIMKPGEFIIVDSAALTITRTKKNDDEINYIYIAQMSDIYEKVVKEIKNWSVRDSHELLTEFPDFYDLEPTSYSMLPISCKFSFKTAEAVYHILKDRKNKSSLETVDAHFPPDKTEKIYREINILEKHPERMFKYIPTSASWRNNLLDYVSLAPLATIIELCELCTGERPSTMRDVINSSIVCIGTKRKGVVEFVAAERLLVIGKFKKANSLFTALNRAIYESKAIN